MADFEYHFNTCGQLPIRSAVITAPAHHPHRQSRPRRLKDLVPVWIPGIQVTPAVILTVLFVSGDIPVIREPAFAHPHPQCGV